jgi:hypothetical protein
MAMRAHRTTVLLFGLVLVSVLFAACRDYRVQEVAPLPTRIEVEGPTGLTAVVADMQKRPLEQKELPALHRAGFRWDYTVRVTNTGSSGVRLEQVDNRLRSLTGVTATETSTLPSRVEAGGTTPISVRAALSSTDPMQRGELQGVQELTFRGRDDAGQPVRLVVRVPLA